MPTLTHSVGATVRTVSSAPVGWVGSGEVLHTPTTNNEAKYKALFVGMAMVNQLRGEVVELYSDS